jgi:hypothetical protein
MKKELAKKVGVWALAVALLVAHFFFRTVAHADTGYSSWKQFFAKSGECRISFPSAPQLVQQSLRLNEAGHRLNYDVYLAPFEDKGVCLLLIATYPMPLAGGHEIAGLEGLIRGIVGHNPDNKLVFADLKDFDGHPAMDFLVQSGASYFRGHALMVGNKLFLVAMEGKVKERDEKTYTQYLKSFKLLN